MDIFRIILICVAIVAAGLLGWLIVEGALTVRRLRSTITDLKERVEPVISHAEGIMESLRPAIDRVDPLVERASLTVDALNVELMQVDKILNDASSITGTAKGAVDKISDVANAPSNLAHGAAEKLRGVFGRKKAEDEVEKALANSAQKEALNAANETPVDKSSLEDVSNIVSDWAKQASEKTTARASKQSEQLKNPEKSRHSVISAASSAKVGDKETSESVGSNANAASAAVAGAESAAGASTTSVENAGAANVGASGTPNKFRYYGAMESDDDTDVEEPDAKVAQTQTQAGGQSAALQPDVSAQTSTQTQTTTQTQAQTGDSPTSSTSSQTSTQQTSSH